MLRIIPLFLLVMWLVVWLPPVALAYAFKKKKLRGRMVKFVCKGLLRILGVQLKIIGEPSNERPLLMVSNHISYLDIWILASAVDCRFVPKSEIAQWPVIGLICRILDVVFIDRSTGKIMQGNQAIASALAQGEIVALFPEATTGDGKHMLPFKPAFFESAQGAAIQPAAIAYRKIRGLPIDYGQWPLIAWYGDMSLLPHLWKLLSLGKIEAELHFLPLMEHSGEGRKQLALQAQSAIEAALLEAGGRA
jgi:1-acyl-sn-glycerol-3-phosphate acyltransferase